MATLFNITVPSVAPSSVWPYDPDMGLTKSRSHHVVSHSFSPLLKQKYVMSAQPLIVFSIGYNTMQGDFAATGTKFADIWAFWTAHKGRSIPFYFYDPVPWGNADHTPTNYRENPAARMTSPGTGANPAPTTGRYIVTPDNDNLSVEQFALLCRRTKLTFSGIPG